jgi:glycosyltransferase involved in cell wall biosynthesis
MAQPLISIIIPYFNSHAYFRELLESVGHQSYHQLEMIIVDDGSTPESVQILQTLVAEYQEKFPIQIIRQENQGVAAARNTGIAAAQGEFVHFLDADDMICGRHSLLARVVFLQNHPEFAGIAGYSVKISPSGEVQLKEQSQTSLDFFMHAAQHPDQLLEIYCKNVVESTVNSASTLFFVAGSGVFRLDAVKKTLFDPHFESEDDVEWIIRFLQTYAISVQLCPYHFRRVHADQYHFATPSQVTQEVVELAKKYAR